MATFERDGEANLVGQHKKNRRAARGSAGQRQNLISGYEGPMPPLRCVVVVVTQPRVGVCEWGEGSNGDGSAGAATSLARTRPSPD